MTDIKALLREAIESGEPTDWYAAIQTAVDKLEAAAESLGEPAAWLVSHPKYMPEPCVEIASSDYHDHGVMETEKAQGWVFTPLYTAKEQK